MDSANDLTISVAKNSPIRELNWEMFVPYVVSLIRTRFKGTKLMFVSGVSDNIRQNLESAGFMVIDFSTGSGTFGFERIKPILKFLNEHAQDFRNVIWTDWPDVVFQSDPSVWLEKNLKGHRLVGSTDSVTIENGGGTDTWIKWISLEAYEQLKEYDACCCGTIIGEAQALRDLLQKMYEMLSADLGLIDQGVLNFLLRTTFKEITLFPKLEDGCVGGLVQFLGGRTTIWTNPHPVLKDGIVYPAGKSEPFVLLHQHNRNLEWWNAISRRYTECVPGIVKFPADDRRRAPTPQVTPSSQVQIIPPLQAMEAISTLPSLPPSPRPLRAPRRLR
jgi:hypothetical protein